MRKLWYWLLIFGFFFMVLQDPTSSGRLVASFFEWMGDGFSAFFEFIDSFVDPNPGVGDLDNNTLDGNGVPVPEPAPDQGGNDVLRPGDDVTVIPEDDVIVVPEGDALGLRPGA